MYYHYCQVSARTTTIRTQTQAISSIMANSPTPTMLALLALGLTLILSAAGPAAAQNCGCQSNLCCSKHGYCGTGNDYCGEGCREGPCYNKGGSSGGNTGVPVESVVTEQFFNGIKNQAPNNCVGKSFYTRQSFINAARSYSGFAKGRSNDDSKREIAAFFAHITHETGHMCYTEEINGASRDYCDRNNKQWPCQPGKAYFGRGPIQISWNYNYGPAGQAIGFDGLRNPERVSQDPTIAFKTALWFWMNNVHQVMPQGFGATIRAINGNLECNGKNPGAVNARINYYKDYCRQFGVDPGGNLYC
uniref:chitinase n=1 Tax=Leersia perrieri TaxID=77586 RepID=A0A0D9W6M9_9ORYZ